MVYVYIYFCIFEVNKKTQRYDEYRKFRHPNHWGC